MAEQAVSTGCKPQFVGVAGQFVLLAGHTVRMFGHVVDEPKPLGHMVVEVVLHCVTTDAQAVVRIGHMVLLLLQKVQPTDAALHVVEVRGHIVGRVGQ